MIEYILISYVVMLARFIYVMTAKTYKPPVKNINVKVGVFIAFVLVVGLAPVSFVIFITKSIFK